MGIKSPFQKVCSVIPAHVHTAVAHAAVHAVYIGKSLKKVDFFGITSNTHKAAN
jgi:hypothetical protein